VSLRLRVALTAAVAVLVTIAVSSVALYFGVRQHLYDQVDASLSKVRAVPGALAAFQQLEHALESGLPPGAVHALEGQQDYIQFVDGEGRVTAHLQPTAFPASDLARLVARGTHPDAFFNVTADGSPIRVYAFHLDYTTAVEVGHSLSDVTSVLHDVLAVTAVVAAAGVALAVVIGALVAFAALRPVRRFSAAVRAVAETGELSHHVQVSGHDEFSQVASGFNAMLDALGESLSRQRRLVADASHVLRTPLATVRTNVEVLRRADELDASERAQLIRDTVAQIAELTHLVNNLIELARGEEETGAFGTVRLEDLVASIVEEARRNYPSVPFDLSTVPSTVWGSPDRLSKALGNLLDNAAKWTRPSTPVEVTVEDRSVTVRDHGPGVDAADVPRIFDRFYRSLSARGVPGSGLGLAIAKQAVEAHGGHIEVRDAAGGGAEFAVRFPEPPGN
jgi:two-component system, OmpR family, sensor histidine kinase MprB